MLHDPECPLLYARQCSACGRFTGAPNDQGRCPECGRDVERDEREAHARAVLASLRAEQARAEKAPPVDYDRFNWLD